MSVPRSVDSSQQQQRIRAQHPPRTPLIPEPCGPDPQIETVRDSQHPRASAAARHASRDAQQPSQRRRSLSASPTASAAAAARAPHNADASLQASRAAQPRAARAEGSWVGNAHANSGPSHAGVRRSVQSASNSAQGGAEWQQQASPLQAQQQPHARPHRSSHADPASLSLSTMSQLTSRAATPPVHGVRTSVRATAGTGDWDFDAGSSDDENEGADGSVFSRLYPAKAVRASMLAAPSPVPASSWR